MDRDPTGTRPGVDPDPTGVFFVRGPPGAAPRARTRNTVNQLPEILARPGPLGRRIRGAYHKVGTTVALAQAVLIQATWHHLHWSRALQTNGSHANADGVLLAGCGHGVSGGGAAVSAPRRRDQAAAPARGTRQRCSPSGQPSRRCAGRLHRCSGYLHGGSVDACSRPFCDCEGGLRLFSRLRISPPVHPEAMPRRVPLIREVEEHAVEKRAGEIVKPKFGSA